MRIFLRQRPTTNLSSSRNRSDAITPSFELVMQYSKQMKTIRMTNQNISRQFSFVIAVRGMRKLFSRVQCTMGEQQCCEEIL